MTLEEARKLVGDWWDGPGYGRSIDDWLKHIRILEQVNALGYKIKSIYNLGQKVNDVRLVPIVTEMLGKFKKLEAETYLIREMRKPIYKELVPALIERYKQIDLPLTSENLSLDNCNDSSFFRITVADVILGINCKDYIGGYLEIISKDEYIIGCHDIITLLCKLKERRALDSIIRLLIEFPNAYKWIILKHIGNYKDSELVQYVEPFLNDSEAEIRQMAKKAIERLKK